MSWRNLLLLVCYLGSVLGAIATYPGRDGIAYGLFSWLGGVCFACLAALLMESWRHDR